MHGLGVVCGLAAGAWLGAAEAPVKLVTTGLSPFLISFGMVAGVFVGRWTLPAILKGTGFVFADLRRRAHLVVWAVLAGALWAVANTLTVFAIRDVGLSIAFPLWNTNSLVGVFWGWFFFRELRGSGLGNWSKVLGGAVAIVGGAVLLAYASARPGAAGPHRDLFGVAAALCAGLMWGTMYIPYRKAYLSGMNPLSFVTVFTVGEMTTVTTLALAFQGGWRPLTAALAEARPALFWLFLGGFCWVVGDLFQQYAAKYIGIGRGIPLSNTNQLWGLAWGALVFGELAGARASARGTVIAGSAVMILGAIGIASAVAPAAERAARSEAVTRECSRYGLERDEAEAALAGEDPSPTARPGVAAPRTWDALIAVLAVAAFVGLGTMARQPAIALDTRAMAALLAATASVLVVAGTWLWKRTRFS